MHQCDPGIILGAALQILVACVTKLVALWSSDGSVTLKLRYVLQTNSQEALLRSLLQSKKKHVTCDVRSSNWFVAWMNHLTGPRLGGEALSKKKETDSIHKAAYLNTNLWVSNPIPHNHPLELLKHVTQPTLPEASWSPPNYLMKKENTIDATIVYGSCA